MRIIATLHRRSFVELFGNDSGFLTGFALHGGRLKWRLQAGYNKGVPANPGVTVISARESIASIPSFAPPPGRRAPAPHPARSEEHTSELQSLMRISYAVFCLKKKHATQRRERKQAHQ